MAIDNARKGRKTFTQMQIDCQFFIRVQKPKICFFRGGKQNGNTNPYVITHRTNIKSTRTTTQFFFEIYDFFQT